MTFRLSRAARSDLIGIYIEGRELFGEAQATRYHGELEHLFALLAENPRLARVREELRQPVRGHPYKRHIIFYNIEDDGGIVIRRIRHASEDWLGEERDGS